MCGARLGPGVAQAHFLQELQHLYSLSALPRDAPVPSAHSLHHQDEDARWEVGQKTNSDTQQLRLFPILSDFSSNNQLLVCRRTNELEQTDSAD